MRWGLGKSVVVVVVVVHHWGDIEALLNILLPHFKTSKYNYTFVWRFLMLDWFNYGPAWFGGCAGV